MKIYAIWKPSQIDAIQFLNRNNLAEQLMCAIPDKTSNLQGGY